MAKKKSSGNNNKKVKLVKRKCANVFKAKSSGRSKYVGKVVDTALRKNLTQAKDVEDSNKEFENVRELLACKKQKQSKRKSKLKPAPKTNYVSKSEVDQTVVMMQGL